MNKTRSIHLSDTAVVQKEHITNPAVTAGDRMVHTAAKLINKVATLELKKKADGNMNDLQQLAEISRLAGKAK